MFSTHQETNNSYGVKFILSSVSVLKLDQSKILSFCKALKQIFCKNIEKQIQYIILSVVEI